MTLDIIYLVGGFPQSKYIYQSISTHFGNDYKYITPAEPDFAAVYGAVLFRQHPDIAHAQRADATYGVAASIPFDPLCHDPDYKCIKLMTMVQRCAQIFFRQLLKEVT